MTHSDTDLVVGAGQDGTAPVDLTLLPASARLTAEGRLEIGGCDLLDVAAEFGTPLFVYDEQDLRESFRAAAKTFGEGVAYATKAFLTPTLARLAHSEGVSFDVSTAGEYECCRRAGVPADKLVVHGNNKLPGELRRAVEEGVQWIVIDNFDELDRLATITRELGRTANVLIRMNPGVEVHTHKYIATGNRESKFGFPTWTDDAERAVERARSEPFLNFMGLHLHIGSFVLSVDTFMTALDAVTSLVDKYDSEVLVVGGGLGQRYLNSDVCPTFEEWGSTILAWGAERFPGKRVLAEPGRVLVARAGVTLYTAGMVQAKGDLNFLAVDGGMSDNPRPMLYESGYEVFNVNHSDAPRTKPFRLVGRHCESGDTIIEDAYLPERTAVGDIVCTPVTGAYGYSMASNYNLVTRPAIVFVSDGRARLVTRRETLDDLFAREVE